MVLEHIASGMYGMVIVEPRNGYPTKVDREYAVVQSEFYTRLDPQKRKVDGVPLYVLDTERVRTKAPTYTVFNGRYNGLVDHPFQSKPGERVRLFLLNVGPSNTSSFHVVGTIFDRVWLEGNPDNQLRGSQTVLLGSSNSAIVEFMIPEAGSYVMVDHHFANASQGAIGLVAAGEPPAGAGESEHHNIPATGAPTDYGTTVYRPPAALRELVLTRTPRCSFPSCLQPAHRGDLDHRERYDGTAGTGPTNEHNLDPYCRRHHRTKHTPGWSVNKGGNGTVTWTSPSGHTWTHEPPPIAEPVLQPSDPDEPLPF